MSAFMVSKAHIDALVSLDRGAHTDDDWRRLGTALIAANLRIIHARYPDTVERPEHTPGPIERFWETEYVYQRPAKPLSIAQGLKALACFEYQSCESKEWQGSFAQQWCDARRAFLINMLPGYEQAAWEIT